MQRRDAAVTYVTGELLLALSLNPSLAFSSRNASVPQGSVPVREQERRSPPHAAFSQVEDALLLGEDFTSLTWLNAVRSPNLILIMKNAGGCLACRLAKLFSSLEL
jgi:hypothetical protein